MVHNCVQLKQLFLVLRVLEGQRSFRFKSLVRLSHHCSRGCQLPSKYAHLEEECKSNAWRCGRNRDLFDSAVETNQRFCENIRQFRAQYNQELCDIWCDSPIGGPSLPLMIGSLKRLAIPYFVACERLEAY